MTFPHTIPRRSPLAILLHIVALASLSWSFNELWKPSPMTDFMDSQFGGHWTYLTILSLAAAWLTFAFSLAYDLVPIALFARIKTSLAVLAVPVEGLVGLLYWSLTLFNPALLNPPTEPGKEPFRIPLALDVSLHGLPALYLWLDFLAFSPRFSSRARPHLLMTTAASLYVLWMEYAAGKNRHYPYPMLDDMTPGQRSVFYLFQVPTLIALYHAANYVHGLVRGSSSNVQENEARKVRKAEDKVAAKSK
ncbi:hypothetical protein JCM10908_005543 [Rhodotorula pacifica]|uniref:uncharacterized protein n=1 Tax=Rhodotorula pacifica TaxID=1495444 RepID=UPI0031745491